MRASVRTTSLCINLHHGEFESDDNFKVYQCASPAGAVWRFTDDVLY